LAKNEPMQKLDLSRYHLYAPESDTPELWKKTVDNDMAQVALQELQYFSFFSFISFIFSSMNLDLLSNYGENTWIVYNKNIGEISKRFAFSFPLFKISSLFSI
jgi:hypothetical protein